MENKKAGKPETGRSLREGNILDSGDGVCIKISHRESARDGASIYVSHAGNHVYSYEVLEGNGKIEGTPIYESPFLDDTRGVFVRLSQEQLRSGDLLVPVRSADGRYCYEVFPVESERDIGTKRYTLKKKPAQKRPIDVMFSEDEKSKFEAEMR
ncbi:MAG: hypothetical protein PHH00_01960 [Candidatus Nanoarchaeia archaeon]|nr:hypothetical protein [Candidatus Nanoarchaeia archaeon]